MRVVFFLMFVSLFSKSSDIEIEKQSLSINGSLNNLFQHDSSTTMLKKFRAFSKEFFNAIKSSDTNFLETHVIFPIYNSSFTNMDSSLMGIKKINQVLFFKHLKKLFPKDLIGRIGKDGKFEISGPKDGQKEYTISLYDTSEIEYDFTWSFIEKRNEFYFIRFRAEPG